MIRLTSALGGKSEIDDIPVLDDVLLAFETDFPVLAARLHGASSNQTLIGDDFGADKPALDVAVNLAGGVLRGCSARD